MKTTYQKKNVKKKRLGPVKDFYAASTLNKVIVIAAIVLTVALLAGAVVLLINKLTYNGREKIEGNTLVEMSLDIGDVGIYTVPENVTVIGEAAFSGNSTVREIVIHDGVTTIGSAAFYGCTGLTAVNIPESVTSIGDAAFYYCSSLKSIDLRAKIKDIFTETFLGCNKLESITIPASVERIWTYAFSSCSALKTVIFEEGSQLEDIGYVAFYNCSSLTSLQNLDKLTNLKKVSDRAFLYCSGLTSVIFPEQLPEFELGPSVFSYCTALRTVRLPEGLTEIPDLLFQNCTKLVSVNIPSTVKSIGWASFFATAWFNNLTEEDYYIVGDGVLMKCNVGRNVDLELDVSSPIKTIGGSVFWNYLYDNTTSFDYDKVTDDLVPYYSSSNNLTEVYIPAGVKTIASGAFHNCTELKKVEFAPDSVLESIGEGAFIECTSLESIVIPSTVREIGNFAFFGCTLLSDVTIPSTVDVIGDLAFYYTAWLMNKTDEFVIAGNGVLLHINPVYEDDGADSDPNAKKKLKSTTLDMSGTGIRRISGQLAVTKAGLTDEGLTQVTSVNSDLVFGQLNGITDIILPNTLVSIGESAFSSTTTLENVVIPNGVVEIGNSAFYGCTALKSISLPDSVEKVGAYAFYKCENLKTAELSNNLKELDEYTFGECSSLKKITVPESVETIWGYAFIKCTGLDPDDFVISERFRSQIFTIIFGSGIHPAEINWVKY